MSVFQSVKDTIISRNLIAYGETVIVGFSGGADSSCLLHILSRLREDMGITLVAAHINHNLRSEAARDQLFAERFCDELGIVCRVLSADVHDYAKRNKISSEQAGREIRYDFFYKLKNEFGADKIATAHNKNDAAETVLMNFIRGSGLAGLVGIPYAREDIVRPILSVSREQIERYCHEYGIQYVTDHTNFEPVYTRNKLRLDIIPLIEKQVNPNFTERVVKNAEIIRDENEFLNIYSRRRFENLSIKSEDSVFCAVSDLQKEHRAVVRRIILFMAEYVMKSGKNISSEYVDNVIGLIEKNITGKGISLCGGISARIEYGRLVIGKDINRTGYRYAIGLDKPVYIPEAGIEVNASLCDAFGKSGKNIQYFKKENIGSLYVRTRENGDFFYPVGMTGKKKLKDYFIDCKVSRPKRDSVPLLISGNNILWVMGMRADRRYIAGESGECIKVEYKAAGDSDGI